jgi:hypothetical protein
MRLPQVSFGMAMVEPVTSMGGLLRFVLLLLLFRRCRRLFLPQSFHVSCPSVKGFLIPAVNLDGGGQTPLMLVSRLCFIALGTTAFAVYVDGNWRQPFWRAPCSK